MAFLLICGFLSGLCLTALSLSSFASIVPALGITGISFGISCILLTRWYRRAPDAPVFSARWPAITLGVFATATTIALTFGSFH